MGVPSSGIRQVLRALARAPGFTIVVLLTLALSIGANTTIFSVINAVVLRPLPFPGGDRIVRIRPGVAQTAHLVDAISTNTGSYAALASAASTRLTLTGLGSPELFATSVVGVSHFEVFGVTPVLGRGFTQVDGSYGAPPVAILSWGLWQRRFGGDTAIVGRAVPLGGEGHATRTVIGITPPDYQPFPWGTDVLVPVALEPGSHEYTDMGRFALFGRLATGTTLGNATAELRVVLERLVAENRFYVSAEQARSALVVGEHAWRVEDVRRALWLLFGAVGAVLLIGCVNVANLLLARSAARAPDLAVRHALGAGRSRIVRMLLVESLILGLGGGALGGAAAALGVPALVRLIPPGMPRVDAIRVDVTVLAFTVGVSLVGTLLFGLLPALRSGTTVERSLREGGRGGSPARQRLRMSRVLVAGEVAMCLVLAASAGLFLKSMSSLKAVDPGFDADNLLTMRLTPPVTRYATDESLHRLIAEVEQSVAAVPGVTAVGAINVLPMSSGQLGVGISPDGRPVPNTEQPVIVSYRVVTPGYMNAMRIRLVEGRTLTPGDGRPDAPPMGLINASMSAMMFPGRSAVGRPVHWSTGDLWFTVAGVVVDVHQNSLARDARAEVYVLGGASVFHLVARSFVTPVLSAVRAAVWAVDPEIPVTGEASMETLIHRSLATERFHATLFSLFAALALTLAAVGVFGVTSYVVSLRTHEIGIRMAFGATAGNMALWILRTGAVPVAAGLAAGLVLSRLGTRLLSTLLYGVSPGDPIVLGAVVAVVLLMAVAAMAVPAWRAARVDPMGSLTND